MWNYLRFVRRHMNSWKSVEIMLYFIDVQSHCNSAVYNLFV